jgi:CcmD family protein
MGNAIYLFSAYSIAWVVIFLYAFGISRRQKGLETQIAEMKKILKKEC